MDEKLLNLKLENEFKQTIHNTRNLIKRDTANIPELDSLNDNNKGAWVEHDESNFNKIFEGLLDYCADEECYDNLDWNSVNYTTYGADYYEERFPGFAPEVYEILAKSTEEENKIVDHRVPPLKISNEEVVLSFK
jgi:alpha-L-fucosidase